MRIDPKYLVIFLLGLLAPSIAIAAGNNDDELIERLESSGKLDAAVDRAIERKMESMRVRREAEAKAAQDARKQAAKKVRPLDRRDRIYGAENARISLIVWSDPECPYCKRFAGKPQKVIDQSEGLANTAIRLLPLSNHGPRAIQASIDALCVADQAGAKGYYTYFDGYLAATQGNGKGIPDGKGGQSAQVVMARLLKRAGATDTKKLKSCQRSEETMSRLRFEYDEAGMVGVEGTPAIILLNNETGEVDIVAGAAPVEMLLESARNLAGVGKDAKTRSD